jgi:hypothetical protein
VSGERERVKNEELPTEFCLGTDGCSYVNAEGIEVMRQRRARKKRR